MDPFSLTVGGLALFQAAGGCINGLKKLRAICNNKEEVQRLIKDTKDLQSLCGVIDNLRTRHDSFKRQAPEVLRLSTEVQENLNKLQEIITEQNSSSRLRGIVKWALNKEDVEKIRRVLQNTLNRIQCFLGALNVHNSYEKIALLSELSAGQEQLKLLVEEVIVRQSTCMNVTAFIPRTQSQVSIENGPDRPSTGLIYSIGNDSDQPSAGLIHSGTIENSLNQSSTDLIYSGNVEHADIDFNQPLEGGSGSEYCEVSCACQCHSKVDWTSPWVLTWLIGRLSVSSSKTALLRRQCNMLSCKQSLGRGTCITYRFPLWFLRNKLLVCLSTMATQGPEMLLRLQTVRPENAVVFWYAENGDLRQLQHLFDTRQASPWDVTPTGETALQLSAKRQHHPTTKYLLDQKADKYFENRYGMSAVSYAWEGVLTKKFRSQNVLVQKNVLYELFGDTDYLQSQGFNRLHRIVMDLDNIDLEQALQVGGYDIDGFDKLHRTPLTWAAIRGDFEKVRTLLKYGATLYEPALVYRQVLWSISLTQPLDDPQNMNLLEVVQILHEIGVESCFRDKNIHTIYHAMARHPNGHELLRFLCDDPSDLSTRDEAGRTPLDYACMADHYESVKVLVTCGANIDSCNFTFPPSIFLAIEYNSYRSLDLLLKAQAALDFVDIFRESRSILHYLAACANLRTLQCFHDAEDLSSMPDPNYRTTRGETALEFFDSQRCHHCRDPELYNAFSALLDYVRINRLAREPDAIISHCLHVPGSWPEEKNAESSFSDLDLST